VIIDKLLTKSAIRVILTLLVGVFIGIKFPEGKQVTCTVADVLNVNIQQCEAENE